MDKPVVPNAPGLIWKNRGNKWEARWQARSDLVKRGYPFRGIRLWAGDEEPSSVVKDYISDRCQILQEEMLAWGRGGSPQELATYDGTIASLIAHYKTDKYSRYKKIRFRTREFYDALCRRLEKDYGHYKIADLRAKHMMQWHEDIAGEQQKIAMAHSVMGMLRTLLAYGLVLQEDDDCARVALILNKMRLPMAKPRTNILTAEQVVAIRAEAHRRGMPSIALAQAFQFEGILRQKDIIGEWVPITEELNAKSEIFAANNKWIRGIRWDEIDSNMVLKHVTSKRQKEIVIDLRLAPMVMEELKRFDIIPKRGPIIVSENTRIPYSDHAFRRHWRDCATACGVPLDVRNMDTRAGAISEATDAGSDLESVRHAATHSNILMTQRYSRNAEEKTASVQRARRAHRTTKNEE